jgi:hypothetical protein
MNGRNKSRGIADEKRNLRHLRPRTEEDNVRVLVYGAHRDASAVHALKAETRVFPITTLVIGSCSHSLIQNRPI